MKRPITTKQALAVGITGSLLIGGTYWRNHASANQTYEVNVVMEEKRLHLEDKVNGSNQEIRLHSTTPRGETEEFIDLDGNRQIEWYIVTRGNYTTRYFAASPNPAVQHNAGIGQERFDRYLAFIDSIMVRPEQ